MTTAMQIGETARDRADFCRCFKTSSAVFLHDDWIFAHSTYRITLRAAYMLAPTNSETRAASLSEHECDGYARPTSSESLLPAPFGHRPKREYDDARGPVGDNRPKRRRREAL